ncbi:DUF7768 domain-containing protein [Lacrimispora brassicae]
MKKVFICSPFQRDIKGNTEKARRYCRRVYEASCIPVAPHLLFPQFLDEMNETERAAGIAMGLALLLDCDEIWVYGEATAGMEQEIRFAVEHGRHVCFKNEQEGDGVNEAGNDYN